MSSVENILSVTQSIQTKLEEAATERQKDIRSLVEKNAALEKENYHGRRTSKPQQLRWRSFRDKDQPDEVLVGDSILRDVSSDLLMDTQVVCKKGAKLSDIEETVRALPRGYDRITLIAGEEHPEGSGDEGADAIVRDFGGLIDCAERRRRK